MNEEPVDIPAARSWREISPAKPRALSRGARWRQSLHALRLPLLLVFGVSVVATGFFVARAMRSSAPQLPTVAKLVPVKKVRLKTTPHGVLDDAWLARTLELPARISLQELDLARLLARVKADEQVTAASITRVFPDELIVHVEERTPVARVRTQFGSTPRDLLVARDGVVFAGYGFDPGMIQTLPWLGGLILEPVGAGFRRVPQMKVVSALLNEVDRVAPHLGQHWRIVSVARIDSDQEIEVTTDDHTTIVFSAKGEFFVQLSNLDYIMDRRSKLRGMRARIDLSLGRDVPVMMDPLPASTALAAEVKTESVKPRPTAFRSTSGIRPSSNVSSKTTFIGAVEIGTSKIAVLIGEHNGRELSIIGRGECSFHGIMKGAVVDKKAASDCTHSALEQAEREAGERIDTVFLAQTGAHLEGFYNEAAISVKASDNVIEPSDVRTVCDLARSKALPEGRSVVHHIRRPYRVDGQMIPGSPVDLSGQRLEVGYWTVHGHEPRLADNLHVIRGFNLEVGELVVASLASGFMVTSAEERQHGVLAIDIGAGTTDFVLYKDGAPHTTGVVPVGGSHLTNDLAIGLRLTEGQAEKLKLRFGRANVQTKDKAQKVWLDGNFAIGDRQFSQQAIEQITSARAWEIFEVVKKKLGNAFSVESCAAGVVITGGTAKLAGIADVAAKVFGAPAHLGEAPSWVSEHLRDPGYHTALGLLYYGVAVQAEKPLPVRRGGRFITGMKRLFSHA